MSLIQHDKTISDNYKCRSIWVWTWTCSYQCQGAPDIFQPVILSVSSELVILTAHSATKGPCRVARFVRFVQKVGYYDVEWKKHFSAC